MKPSTDAYPFTPVPQFMTWAVPPDGFDPPEWSSPLHWWQEGYCAMCGAFEGSQLVIDHDHTTGLERGLLCRRCNGTEAQSEHPAWVAWRSGCNPARLLGHERIYVSAFTGRPAIDVAASDSDLDVIAEAVTR